MPASIANLGPGLDTLGLAVSLYLRVRVTSVVDGISTTRILATIAAPLKKAG